MSEAQNNVAYSGHLLAGFLLLFFGIFWTCTAACRHHITRSTQKKPNNCLKIRNLMRKVDFWDAILSTIAGLFGSIVHQVYTKNNSNYKLFDDAGNFTMIHEWHHSTMYTFYAFGGFIKLAVEVYPTALPTGMDSVVLSLAFFTEGFLFMSHTHGRNALNVSMHTMLVYVNWATALFFAVAVINGQKHGKFHKCKTTTDFNDEVAVCNTDRLMASKEKHLSQTSRKNETSNLVKWLIGVSTIVHGMWYIQLAHSLYSPKSWDDNHINMSFATMFFMWHIFAAVVTGIFIYIGCFVASIAKRTATL